MDFPGARSIAVIERKFENKKRGGYSSEQVAYISSLVQPDPASLLAIARSHWTIENSFHYIKDVTFNEDRQIIRIGNGPFNMSLLRSFAISVANLANAKSMPDAIGHFKNYPISVLKSFKVRYGLAGG